MLPNDLPLPVRTLVIDPDDIARAGLRTLLAGDARFAVVDDVADDGVGAAQRLHPDLVLLDPAGIVSATDHIEDIATASPKSRICIYTATTDHKAIVHALLAGADGYLLKRQRPTAELLHQLYTIAAFGDPIIDQVIVGDARVHLQGKVQVATTPSDNEPPTARELDVLREIAAGYSDGEIEKRLNISQATIRTHAQHLTNKLKARNRPHLVWLACEQGLLNEPPATRK